MPALLLSIYPSHHDNFSVAATPYMPSNSSRFFCGRCRAVSYFPLSDKSRDFKGHLFLTVFIAPSIITYSHMIYLSMQQAGDVRIAKILTQ